MIVLSQMTTLDDKPDGIFCGVGEAFLRTTHHCIQSRESLFLSHFYVVSYFFTAARLLQSFPANVAKKFEKIQPTIKYV
jgi:hypothetical protein